VGSYLFPLIIIIFRSIKLFNLFEIVAFDFFIAKSIKEKAAQWQEIQENIEIITLQKNINGTLGLY
jgi:hypothetical protein